MAFARLVGTLIAFLLVVVVSTEAAEYGPRVFERDKGAPQLVVETFTRVVMAERYDLVVVNGTSAGAARVSSAHIWVNGALVAGPSDFSQTIGSLRKPVQLREGQNKIAVKLASAPGSRLTVRISAVLGTAGGTISVPDGPSFTVPAGALPGDTELGLRPVPFHEVANAVPKSFAFLAAVEVDLGGVFLGLAGDLAVPHSMALQGRAIAARLIPFDGPPKLALIDTASLVDGRLQTNSPPFPGVREGGKYVFLDMPKMLGIAGVNVKTATNASLENAYVSFVPKTLHGAEPQTIVSSFDALQVFVGIADREGLATLPGILPGADVTAITSVPGVGTAGVTVDVATLGFPTLPDVIAGGFVGAWLQDLVVLAYTNVNPNNLPSAPPTCPCTLLQVNPHRIPSIGGPPFPPADRRPLQVTCSGETATPIDVTDWFDLNSFNFLQGAQVGLTYYRSQSSAVATVEGMRPVEVVAQAPGQTSVDIWNLSAQLYATHDPWLPSRRIASPFFCVARGAVAPVTVGCPTNAPHWNGISSRCEGTLTVGTAGPGGGSVSLSPGGANCGATCSSYLPSTTVQVTASPDPGSAFDHWAGDCSGTSTTTSVLIDGPKTCTAVFRLQGNATVQGLVRRYAYFGSGDPRNGWVPVVGMEIQIYESDATCSYEGTAHMATTDQNGAYSFALPPGTYCGLHDVGPCAVVIVTSGSATTCNLDLGD